MSTIKNKGQNLMEYVVVLGIVALAVMAMQTYFKRGIQSVIKVVADDYGPQGDTISALEKDIKNQIYYGENTKLTGSKSDGTWGQKIKNNGDGNIKTELSGSNTVTANSVWVGGDYRTRRLQDLKSSPP